MSKVLIDVEILDEIRETLMENRETMKYMDKRIEELVVEIEQLKYNYLFIGKEVDRRIDNLMELFYSSKDKQED